MGIRMTQNRGPANWDGLLPHVVPRKYSRLTMLAADISRWSSFAAKMRSCIPAASGMILNKHYEVDERDRDGQNRLNSNLAPIGKIGLSARESRAVHLPFLFCLAEC